MINCKTTLIIVIFIFVIILSGCGQPVNTNSVSSSGQESSSSSLISSDPESFSDSSSITSITSTPDYKKTRFDGELKKISDEIIYGPSVLYGDRIIYANGFNVKDKDTFNYDSKTTSYGILYLKTKNLEKYIVENDFNKQYITNSAIWFTCFYYQKTCPDTSIKYDLITGKFKSIKNDTNPLFIETKNNKFTWIFKGYDKGINQVDKNGNITNYFFSDIEEENYINNFYITKSCLWTDWGGEGSPAGVSYLDFETMKWTHFLGYNDEVILKEKEDPIFYEYLCRVWVDYNGDLYALCDYENGGNIIRYNYEKKKWEVFITVKDTQQYFESDLTFFDDFVILNSGQNVEIVNKSTKELEKIYMTDYVTYDVLTDEKNSTIYFMTDKGVFSQKITE